MYSSGLSHIIPAIGQAQTACDFLKIRAPRGPVCQDRQTHPVHSACLSYFLDSEVPTGPHTLHTDPNPGQVLGSKIRLT